MSEAAAKEKTSVQTIKNKSKHNQLNYMELCNENLHLTIRMKYNVSDDDYMTTWTTKLSITLIYR
jgi:hypothetical protein